jgi:hypothetical protein
MKNRTFFKTVAVLAIMLCFAIPQKTAGASENGGLPDFSDFLYSVAGGKPDIVRGVFVPDVMAYPVVQQPEEDPSAVTENHGEVTQFRLAARHKIIGLLAHNTLAGASFSGLRIGQEIRIIYGDLHVKYFIVNQMSRYKVISSEGRNIGYMDLRTNTIYNTQELFNMYYEGEAHLTFQTCISLGGNTSWGRLFVTGIPVAEDYFKHLEQLDLTDFQSQWVVLKARKWLNSTANLW